MIIAKNLDKHMACAMEPLKMREAVQNFVCFFCLNLYETETNLFSM